MLFSQNGMALNACFTHYNILYLIVPQDNERRQPLIPQIQHIDFQRGFKGFALALQKSTEECDSLMIPVSPPVVCVVV